MVDDERGERRREGRREQEARKKKGGVVKGKAVGRLTLTMIETSTTMSYFFLHSFSCDCTCLWLEEIY